MPAPIIIRNPKLLLQELNPTTFAAVGTAVDMSDDVSSVSLEPEVSIDTVSTFTGKYRVADDPEWSCSMSFQNGSSTSTNWGPLVGKTVEVRVFDRGPATSGAKYRTFRSEVLLDPSLGGATDSEDRTRGFELDFPVYTTPTWATVTP